jgi:hypothetical protein
MAESVPDATAFITTKLFSEHRQHVSTLPASNINPHVVSIPSEFALTLDPRRPTRADPIERPRHDISGHYMSQHPRPAHQA